MRTADHADTDVFRCDKVIGCNELIRRKGYHIYGTVCFGRDPIVTSVRLLIEVSFVPATVQRRV